MIQKRLDFQCISFRDHSIRPYVKILLMRASGQETSRTINGAKKGQGWESIANHPISFKQNDKCQLNPLRSTFQPQGPDESAAGLEKEGYRHYGVCISVRRALGRKFV